MTRRARPWLATLLLLLAAAPARAQEATAEKDSGGFVMGYMGAGVFVCGIIYLVCKPGNRAMNTPKQSTINANKH